MNLSTVRAPKKASENRKRVGRGMGSGMGKTSTRGHKGQRSRSGSRMMRGFEGGQMPLHRRLPKRGFTNIFRVEYAIVNLERLADLGTREITPEVLVKAGLAGKNDRVKVLGDGELKSALTVRAHKFSKSAEEKITKAGGRAEVIGGAGPEKPAAKAEKSAAKAEKPAAKPRQGTPKEQ
ncbi:MAG TPA: 50S ribosomal protein L15 [Terriglobales bacterium]|nr:50S ribosomal protein L15 [Terriglobales bacterium]